MDWAGCENWGCEMAALEGSVVILLPIVIRGISL